MYNAVAEEQHGLRKHHQADLLVLNKVLIRDLFWYTRRVGCYEMNYAKGCFDWIPHTFAVLVLMYNGVAWSVTTTPFQVLQKARHKIKTGYGVLDPVYGDQVTAISGIWQGNGLEAAIWALISSINIEMFKAKGHSMIVTIPISKQDISLLAFAFVNNTDLVSGADNVHTTGTTMVADFQALMTR